MAVPDFQTLMLPLLSHVADGNEHTIAGSRDILAQQFNLTEEERKQGLPSGAANTFYNRLAWAKTCLERAELITEIKPRCKQGTDAPPVAFSTCRTAMSIKFDTRTEI